ncbi:CHASE2 domain-containing protein [Thermosynechococcus sp. PP45]|uniref:CHASE2 domain-containing protein n=1 Tax=unclassified Thermosynechococcus TaxID=2622553 RepID=UPI002673FC3C|nr:MULTISPECIES: CHASE2 domain-containing protein [unclassified Thermosynechococcus]WKT81751.1 CHASE2 domain-containing protein [Thermosynechococcus sp. PP45]WNC25362.1 CHASE2 domain-containing protein [Thermosynechococcus sp. PP551]WNC27940.1 CHASE2 domain-containing protein [Thermosynechococcus sp. PP555]
MTPVSIPDYLKRALPAAIATAIATVGVLALRVGGLLEPLELRAYDQWLRWRSTPATSQRLLIVEITEADIQTLKQYPIPDEVLIQAVNELQEHQPKVIGIDIFRDFPVPDRFKLPSDVLPSLGRVMMTQPNTVIVCKVGGETDPGIAPPAGLLNDQVGFADIPIDEDGVVRRAILATQPEASDRCSTPQSFALALARLFLGVNPQAVTQNRLDLGTARFQALTSNWGGYSHLDAAGFQILINYARPTQPYETVTLSEVLKGQVLPSKVRDRAVLIGLTGSSSNDKFLIPMTLPGQTNRLTPGVVVQAAILEDLLAAALDNRSPMGTWPQGAIALWILAWSGLGALIIAKGQRWVIVPLLVAGGLGLSGLTFLLFLQGSWIPLVAPLVGFGSAAVLMLGYRAFSPAESTPTPSTPTAVPSGCSATPLEFMTEGISQSTTPESAPILEIPETSPTEVSRLETDANATVLQPETAISFTPIEPTPPPRDQPHTAPTLLTSVVDQIPPTEIRETPPQSITERETFLVVHPEDAATAATELPETPTTAPEPTHIDLPETQRVVPTPQPTVPSEIPSTLRPDLPETQLTVPEALTTMPETPSIPTVDLPETQLTLPEPLTTPEPTSTPSTQFATSVDLPETQLSIPETAPDITSTPPTQFTTSADLPETQLSIPATPKGDLPATQPSNPDPLTAAPVDPTQRPEVIPTTTVPSPPPPTTETQTPSGTQPKTTVISDISEKASEPLPQTVGGRYRVLSQLGEGGFGRTFLAADLHLPDHPICVVKQLVPSRKDERFLAIARRLFQREAKTLAQLGQHERIPRLLAYFEEGGYFYLTQEYVDGESLKEEFEKKITLSQAEALTILKSILEILQYVHQFGVVHRDIKPANIMRRRSDQQLFLIDFGAVRHVQPEELLQHGKYTISIGTRGYAPSEQMAGRPVIASDIYSLGMVIVEGLTGLAPMDLPSDRNTGDMIWQPGRHLSPQFVAIINKMIKYNFRDRYQSAAEVLTDLTKAGL